MYRYGIPEGTDVNELKKKIEKIKSDSKQKRNDPEYIKKIDFNSRISSYLSAEDLKRKFTF